MFYRQFVPPMLHCLVLALTTYTGLKLLKHKLRDERRFEELENKKLSLEKEVQDAIQTIDPVPPRRPSWWEKRGW